jgi:hypothetical protein
MTKPDMEIGDSDPPYGGGRFEGQIRVTGPVTMHLLPIHTGSWRQITFFENGRGLGWLTFPIEHINDEVCSFMAGMIMIQLEEFEPPEVARFVNQLTETLAATFDQINEDGSHKESS